MLSVVGSISLRGGARMTTKALGALITAMGVVAGGLPAEAQGPIRIGASPAATTSIFKRPPDKKRSYVFMVISPAEEYLEGLIDTAAKRGLKTVAIVNEDTLFSKAAASGAVELAKKRGMQVVFQEAYPKGNTDFSALLTKVKALTPDVLAAATYFDDAVALTRQMRELDVNPKAYGVTVGGEIGRAHV